MAVKPVLQLGNPLLYSKSIPVAQNKLDELKTIVEDLHDTLIDFRNKTGDGRAIAAPQIGIHKRLIYMYLNEPTVFINPELVDLSKEMFEVWDDCLCFPNLLVKVNRHKSCRILYKDLNWNDKELYLENDLSELLQHEFDHLDGVLAVSKAIDAQSFAYKTELGKLELNNGG